MFSIAKKYKVNEKLASEGFWYTPSLCSDYGDKPPQFKLGRKHLRTNRKYQAKVTRYALENRRNLNRPTAARYAKADAIELQVFCETVLLNWRNMFDEEGHEITYTVEQGVALMNECPDLYEELDDVASDRQNYTEGDVDDIAGK